MRKSEEYAWQKMGEGAGKASGALDRINTCRFLIRVAVKYAVQGGYAPTSVSTAHEKSSGPAGKRGPTQRASRL
jgi:hypothetical protein